MIPESVHRTLREMVFDAVLGHERILRRRSDGNLMLTDEAIESLVFALDPRAAALAEEAKRPGQEGAMARLLQVCDFDQVRGWINAELARGTGPSDRFEVITATAANMLVLVALSVQTKHTRALAQLLGRVSERAHTQLGVVLAERGPDVLTPQRLRIITEDRE